MSKKQQTTLYKKEEVASITHSYLLKKETKEIIKKALNKTTNTNQVELCAIISDLITDKKQEQEIERYSKAIDMTTTKRIKDCLDLYIFKSVTSYLIANK